MNLIPWKSRTQGVQAADRATPFDALSGFRFEIDRMFDRWMRDPWGAWGPGEELLGPGQAVGLPIDVTETEGEVLVRADVPGVDPADLEITLTGDVLTLSGSKKEEHQQGSEGHYVSERRFGTFRRSLSLPRNVDPERIQAEHHNGVVTIRLQKLEGARPKRIPVRSPKG